MAYDDMVESYALCLTVCDATWRTCACARLRGKSLLISRAREAICRGGSGKSARLGNFMLTALCARCLDLLTV